MAKKKFYVVWNGVNPGVYETWEECQQQIKGFRGAVYKSFESEAEAREAINAPACDYIGKAEPGKETKPKSTPRVKAASGPAVYRLSNGETIPNVVLPNGAYSAALAVDAACSGNPGAMEYRGVYLQTGQQVFHFGPTFGTNNVGEFLAIVHALALLQQHNLPEMPVYSDSVNAIRWVQQKKCKTKLERTARTEQLFQLIERAEKWLKSNSYRNPLIKWETKKWGEIPADFGRK